MVVLLLVLKVYVGGILLLLNNMYCCIGQIIENY